MSASSSLEQLAARVASGEDGLWLQEFVAVIKDRLPGTSGVVLFTRPDEPGRGEYLPVAASGEPPTLSPDLFRHLPWQGAGEVLLPLPILNGDGAALWLRTTLGVEEVRQQLAGWLEVAGIGLARRQQVREMERQRAARDHFFSMVNHDLKGPLASIKAMTDLLVRKLGRGTLDPSTAEGREDLMERLAFLSRRAKDMATLIDEIGDLAMIERGRLVLNKRRTDACSILRISIERIEDETGRAITLETSGVPCLTEADEHRLAQIFHILLKNATLYSESGTPVTARVTKGDNQVHIEISDEGRGVSEDQKAHLFQEYGRSVQGPSSGLGIGLYVAAALVAEHGGSLELESEQGEGTTVHVALPLSG
jgi:signal transduction histidine kinase